MTTSTWANHHGIEWHYDYCQRRDTGKVFAIRLEVGETGRGLTGAYGPVTAWQVSHIDLLDYPYDDMPELVAWLRTHRDQWLLTIGRWTNADGNSPF